MKVLLIGAVPPDVHGRAIGGVASHVWDLAQALTREGHSVSLLADNLPPGEVGPVTIEGVTLHRTAAHLDAPSMAEVVEASGPTGCRRDMSFSPFIARGIQEYRQVIEAEQPDVVHVHALEDRFFYAQQAIQGQMPLVTSVHSSHFLEFHDAFDPGLRRALIARNLERAETLVFVSRFVKERYDECLPGALGHQRIRVIHNPIDAESFRPVSIDDARRSIGEALGVPLLLFVGQLIPRKRAHLLVTAARRLADDSVPFRLLIVGDGTDAPLIRNWISENGLESRITVVGPVSRTLLSRYYSAADLFVLPSSMEGFALVYVEAMLCGCPVIGTADSFKELEVSDRCGVHVSSPTPDRLAQSLKAALGRSWDRDLIRRHAMRFDWRAKVADFVRLYEESLVH